MTTQQTAAHEEPATIKNHVDIAALKLALRAAVAAQLAAWATLEMVEKQLFDGADDALSERVRGQVSWLATMSANDIFDTDAKDFLAEFTFPTPHQPA